LQHFLLVLVLLLHYCLLGPREGSGDGVVVRFDVADVHVVGRGRGRVEGKVGEGVGACRFALVRGREGERVREPASEASVSVSTG